MTSRRHSESVDSLIRAFVERLGETIEREIEVRTQALATEWLAVAMASPSAPDQVRLRRPTATPGTPATPESPAAETPADTTSNTATARPTAAAPVRRQRSRASVATSSTIRGQAEASALPSPEQERRDADFARLRALLKPTGHDDASGVVGTLPPPAALSPVEPPADPLRSLEAEVRNQAHALAQLPQTRCTARIAAWAGRVRSYEETDGNRVAADLLLEKLRVLARAMDAGRIEALNGSWRTRDWPSYIRTNEALAEAPQEPETIIESRPDRSGEPDYRDIWSQPS